MPSDVATPAMLLFQLLTFLLPVRSGWLAFTHVTRKGAFVARDPVAALRTAEDGVHTRFPVTPQREEPP